MNQVLIYVKYDIGEYVNYFNMIVNNELVIEYLPVERKEELFETLVARGISDSNMNLQIVADEDASVWDYEEDFEEWGYRLSARMNKTDFNICELLETTIGGKYCLADNSENFDSNVIKILYPIGEYVFENTESSYKAEELLDKVKEIMIKDKEEMTDLARIIMEKYERMNK